MAEKSHGVNGKICGGGCELCLYVWQKKKLKILCVVWEAAWNEMRRDSSEMNPGWSLASTNQITTKGSEASEWEAGRAGASRKEKKKSSRLETPRVERHRDGKRMSASCLIGTESAARLPVRAIALIGLVVDAPAGVSRATAK